MENNPTNFDRTTMNATADTDRPTGVHQTTAGGVRKMKPWPWILGVLLVGGLALWASRTDTPRTGLDGGVGSAGSFRGDATGMDTSRSGNVTPGSPQTGSNKEGASVQ